MFTLTQAPDMESHLKRTQVIIHPDFVGKGHQLEDKKRQRRKVQSDHQVLYNEVDLLNKNNKKLDKQTSNKQNHLEYLLSIKQRKKMEKQQKQIINQNWNNNLLHLKQKIQVMKHAHHQNKNNSLIMINEARKNDYLVTKQKQKQGQKIIKQQIKKNLQQKQSKAEKINRQKYLGLMRMVDYKTKKNRKHIENYNSNIKQEQAKIDNISQEIKYLQDEKTEATTIVQKKTIFNQKFKQMIDAVGSKQLQGFQQGIKQFRSKTLKVCAPSYKNKANSESSFTSEHNPQNMKIKKKVRSTSQQLTRQQRINRTIQLVQRSDIYSIIKRITEPYDDIQTKFKRKAFRKQSSDK